MAEKIIIRAHEDHVLQRTALLKYLRKKRGQRKTAKGYMIPLTTNGDIKQLVEWCQAEYLKSRASADWYEDGDKRQWLRDHETLQRELRGADPQTRYPRNEWFWNKVMLKLMILLQVAKSRPSPTELFMEAVRETVDERLDDADNAIEGAGQVVETVAEASTRAWSGLKIAGIAVAGLIGVAIVVPPIIRAFRE